MGLTRGPRDERAQPSQKRLPTYTVFATPQILPPLAKENLNGTERAAAADVSGTNRHGGWHGRVNTSRTAGRKGGRAAERRQPPRQRGRPKSGGRQPSRPRASRPTAKRTPCRPQPARGAARDRRFDSRRQRYAAVGLGGCREH